MVGIKMVEVPSVVYTHANGESIDIFANRPQVEIFTPGKEISRQPNKVGIVIDPNQGFRVLTCTAKFDAAEIVQLEGYMLPASAPTYDGTYPNVTVKRSGTVTTSFLCILKDVRENHRADDKWMMSLKFIQRSDST